MMTMDKKKTFLVFVVAYIISLSLVFMVKNHNEEIKYIKEIQIKQKRESDNQHYQTLYDNALYMYKQGNYDKAKQEVISIPASWEYYDKIEKLVDDCNSRLLSDLLVKAEEYASGGNYKSALKLLRDSEFSGEISVRSDYEKYAACYVEISLSDAENAYNSDELNGAKVAVNIIEDALSVVSDSRLTEAKVMYTGLLPVSLFEQNVFWGSINDWAPLCSNVLDIEGNTYESARKLWHTENYTFQSIHKISFSLNDNYKKLTGTIVLPKGGLDNNREASNWLEFYDDDGKQIAISPYCNQYNTVVSFSIDVSGVNHLTIICKRDTFLSSGYTYIIGDFELCK